jgi:hypothetical protein
MEPKLLDQRVEHGVRDLGAAVQHAQDGLVIAAARAASRPTW